MNYIDLFAGAGGLSEGFIRAGFFPVAHVEMDVSATQTLCTRVAYHYLKKKNQLEIYQQYLQGKISQEQFYSTIPNSLLQTIINQEISDESIDCIFEKIEMVMKLKGIDSIDLIIGGPPCQAYSLVGRARDPYSKEHDPRNYLYKQYVKFLKKFKPKIFVFENVPGILNAGKGKLFEDIQQYLNEAGYEIEAKILDSSKFGVLQQRKRVILIGWKKKLRLSYPQFQEIAHHYLVKDLIRDFPEMKPGERIDYGSYVKEPSEYLKKYKIRSDKDPLIQHITRPHNDRDREIYYYVIDVWNREKRRLKYTELPERVQTHGNKESFLDRFKVVAQDLHFSHTVVAHIAKDGHYYIHPDIQQLRSISVREAARLQSFPDNYYFEGSRTAVFTQIGNAVPPLMAEQIAQEIKKMLIASS
ncbi:DNA cytosine methyltransferase [Thermoflavimicrobium daqui]|uniref:Cytosine-specific methyltransferase n=1 Tax=Thermoflavimicrobium daqui TaxID=2137476 RepID=A0A364K798_9BACL|nr:DNA cytosine methyltransferase [Thermoflavimicrobium daqui]RAL26175.1 DNA (cytosine-5-)-methyltransferase [Thermoflavimicrobium daqui]